MRPLMRLLQKEVSLIMFKSTETVTFTLGHHSVPTSVRKKNHIPKFMHIFVWTSQRSFGKKEKPHSKIYAYIRLDITTFLR
jgi:hypothetical protein